MENKYYFDTPIGWLLIVENGKAVTQLNFIKDCALGERDQQVMNKDGSNNISFTKATPLMKEAVKQLQEYFQGVRKNFELPLAPKGTVFQQKVWKALQEVPYGETRSYKQIACVAGNEKASRAVGMANNRNPIPIIIPCHRIIGANGKLIGYAGGLEVKEYLLNLENGNQAEREHLCF